MFQVLVCFSVLVDLHYLTDYSVDYRLLVKASQITRDWVPLGLSYALRFLGGDTVLYLCPYNHKASRK